MVTPLESLVWRTPWQSRVEVQEESEATKMAINPIDNTIRFMCTGFNDEENP